MSPDPIAALEAKGRLIRDPVEKLRYLRRGLARFEAFDQRVQSVSVGPVRWLLYRLTRVDRARPLFSLNPNGALDPPPRPRRANPAAARRAVNAALLLLVAAAGIAVAAYSRPRPEPAPVPHRDPVAENLAPPPAGLSPERIWQVETGQGWELFSNGLRIDTTHQVPAEPRRYRVFEASIGMRPEILDRPVGILYHTSESDIWPLAETFNEQLRDSSQNLLRYLRRHQVYHYLIDRFGRVYRIVDEAAKANHAGMSIWSDSGRIYLNLNGPFLGICFETRWEGGRALPITRAQLAAGRALTDYLRARWSIAPGMCVTHGLTSVNAKKHLIGHHLDWARGFPFEAFGLPDLYLRPTPAVALFGFGYDEPFLAVLGEPWPGVREAERKLQAEAQATGRSVAEVQRDRGAIYERWLAEQARDAEEGDRTASAGPAGGSSGRQGGGG